MILSVTMNPSVDISYDLKELKIDDVNRVSNPNKTAGGKGLNVANVLSQLGEDILATGILGGTVGDFIVKKLNDNKIQNDFLRVEKESRNCIAILHEGKQTEILESGPTLSLDEGERFLSKFEDLLSKTTLVTMSGSLPKGLSGDYYHKLIKLSHRRGIPVILDTSGEPLKEVLYHPVKPFAIKPNSNELSQLLGRRVTNDLDELKQCLSEDTFEGITCIVVSMGGDGAFVKYEDQFYKVNIPQINVVNPVGSGDATVAGLAYSLNRGDSIEDSLKACMTTGILNAMEPATGCINTDYFSQYFDLVAVEEVL